ncbi:hypothetical protein IG631_15264 [Alternaria alternata]|nr:hypothetical protein IG631_15264 [Alternaria alternata]
MKTCGTVVQRAVPLAYVCVKTAEVSGSAHSCSGRSTEYRMAPFTRVVIFSCGNKGTQPNRRFFEEVSKLHANTSCRKERLLGAPPLRQAFRLSAFAYCSSNARFALVILEARVMQLPINNPDDSQTSVIDPSDSI